MPRIEKTCPCCKELFSSYECDNRKYCSMKCKNVVQGSRMLGNKYKNGTIPWNKGRKATEQERNILKKIKRPSGKNHPFYGKHHTEETKKKLAEATAKRVGCLCGAWKGGHSKNYKTGYYSKEYKDWRKTIFERDGYKCSECGATGYLTAHHIKSFAYFPELRFDLDNGKTLCEDCHKKTDNYKGRAMKGKKRKR